MLFQKRQDFITKTGVALGDTLQFSLSREFPIEKIILRVTGTFSTAMTTPLADSLQALLKQVTLTVSDGARQRNVVDVSGPALLEYALQVAGLDRNTKASLNQNNTSAFELNYPIFFCHPQTEDPIYSALLLPVNRYNQNPTLTVKVSAATELAASGPVVSGTLTVRCIIVRRQVTVTNWTTWDTELSEITQVFAASGNGQTVDLPIPGAYTGVLLRGYTSTTARGDITSASGETQLTLLGTTLRRLWLTDTLVENDMSVLNQAQADTKFVGSYYLDFLTDSTGLDASDFGSLFNTSGLQTTGAKPQLKMDIGGAYTLKMLIHRVYGDISPLIRGR